MTRTTLNWEMSPEYSRRRFRAQGLAMPVSARRGMPYRSSIMLPYLSRSNRHSGCSSSGETRPLSGILERVDRIDLGQLLDLLGQRRLAAADRAQQVQHLLALLEALRRMQEICIQLHQGLFHAVELGERVPGLDGAVLEDARQARILGGIEQAGLADGFEHALVGRGVGHAIGPAVLEELLQRHFLVESADEVGLECRYQLAGRDHDCLLRARPGAQTVRSYNAPWSRPVDVPVQVASSAGFVATACNGMNEAPMRLTVGLRPVELLHHKREQSCRILTLAPWRVPQRNTGTRRRTLLTAYAARSSARGGGCWKKKRPAVVTRGGKFRRLGGEGEEEGRKTA